MKDIVNLISSSNCNKYFWGNVDESIVLAFERQEDVILPKDYRDFVKKYGTGNFGYIEIFGLGCPDTAIPNISFVMKLLANENLKFPNKNLPIASFNGDYLFLNVDKESKQYGCLASLNGDIKYNSFYDFLKDNIG